MEFTAVVVCGRGKALSPFSQVRSTGIPKALLPIANKPMVHYVLEWCLQANFGKVIVLADEEEDDNKLIQNSVKAFQEEYQKKENTPVQIDVLGYTCDNNGSILHHLYKLHQDKEQGRVLSKNFIILPCDMITNIPPQVIIEAYRNKQDSDLGLLIAYKNQLDIEDKKGKIFPRNYTIYSDNDAAGNNNPVLLDMYNPQDIEFHQALTIRTQMCWRYPASTISNKLLNSGIFIGSCKDIFEIFEEQKDKYTESYFAKRSLLKIVRDLSRRSWKHSNVKESVGLFIVPKQATFFRCNNLPVLMEANRYFMKLQAMNKSTTQHPTKQDKTASAHVGNDSLVGESTELGEKTNVKKSVIGSNCKIGRKNKITGCLILDNVEIGDDVTLENCIIGHDVIIQSKCKLTNCNVESTNEVVTGTHTKNTNLLCLTLEGLVEDEQVIDSSEEISDDDSDEDETSDEDESEFEDEYTGNEDGLFAY
ncbi:Translation initiation factor eIF-2B subunit gamma [Candida viswanathii]|uniref:Translation initiation factor eIF2B subunit gamma n=1 Tax=Candida viswanathii TaxID=5486 RepID=A0A367Y9T6_9ASCO|nr:Translation initiation factor eIF-2B subunit gamma [Candida viswanathii]